MNNRGGADASQAGTSGGRGKWLPRDHHYPLAPAARPIRAGGCSGCVTSGDPFPLPEGPEIADGRGGTARRVKPQGVSLASNLTPARSARLRWARLDNFRPLPRHSVVVLALGIDRNRQHALCCAALGHPPGRLLPCPWLCRRWGIGKHCQHAAPWCWWPRGLAATPMCRPWCRWPRHAGSVVGRVALPGQNRPSYPGQSPTCRPWCRRPRHPETVAGPAR
jgi:hypothetical protein